MRILPHPEPLMTLEGALERYGCSEPRLWAMVGTGTIAAYRLEGNLVRFQADPPPQPRPPGWIPPPIKFDNPTWPARPDRREYQRNYQRKWLAQRRAEFFKDKCCVDCGSTERLEIDHRDPALKVSHGVWSWRRERREAELAKCDVRCNACHKKRHAAKHGGERRYRQGCRCAKCVANWDLVNERRREANRQRKALP